MITDWVVTAGAERFALDAADQAEFVVTVTNPGSTTDRVVVEIVPGEGVSRSWFEVEEPQRLLPGGASASFLVKVRVPPETRAGGDYWLQARAYSASVAPEEGSRLSGRVAFHVPARTGPAPAPPPPLPPPPVAPPPAKTNWWKWALIAIAVFVIASVICCCVWWKVTGPNH